MSNNLELEQLYQLKNELGELLGLVNALPEQGGQVDDSLRQAITEQLGKIGGGVAVAAATVALTTSPAAAETHPVKAGDTVSEIAEKYGVSQRVIQEANPRDVGDHPDLIQVGAEIYIPDHHITKRPAPVNKTTLDFTVQPGDNLNKISKLVGMPKDELAQRMKVADPDYIEAGDRYVIDLTENLAAVMPEFKLQVPETETTPPAAETKHVAPKTEATELPAPVENISVKKPANFDAVPALNGVDPELIKQVTKRLIEKHGATPKAAAYIVGTMAQESSLRPDAHNTKNEDSYGIIQLSPVRRNEGGGMPRDDLLGQVDFIIEVDMQEDYKAGAIRELLSNPSATDEQLRTAMKDWIRWGEEGKRFAYAEELEEALTSTPAAPADPSQPPVVQPPAIETEVEKPAGEEVTLPPVAEPTPQASETAQQPVPENAPALTLDPDLAQPEAVNDQKRAEIVELAKSQVGVAESGGEDRGVPQERYSEGQVEPWCNNFYSWLREKAGIPYQGNPEDGVLNGWRVPWTVNSLELARNSGKAFTKQQVLDGEYTPKPGDAIYYDFNTNQYPVNHIGMIESYDSGSGVIKTVEGNVSDKVVQKEVNISNGKIVYFASL